MKKNLLMNVFVAIFACFAFATVFTSCDPKNEPGGDPADKSELQTLVTECRALLDAATTDEYPQTAIDAFKKVVVAAEAALTNETVTQSAVNNLVVQLTEAKKTFLAAAYGAIPEDALLLGLSFDEGEGTELTAAGKLGLKAVLKAATDVYGDAAPLPKFVDGKVGKAMHFEQSAYIEIARNLFGNEFEGKALSIATWVKLDKTKAANFIVSYNTWHSWKLNIQDGGKPFFTVNLDGAAADMDNEADQSVMPDAWTHVAIAFDGSKHEVNMYVNGKLTKTWNAETKPALAGSTITVNPDKPLLIGMETRFADAVKEAEDGGWAAPTPETWASFLDGTLDEFKIYNIALEAGQVTKLYNDENK